MCLISPISCWHVTRLSRHSVRLMNERQSLHHSQSKVVCQNIFGLFLLKNRNIRIDAYRQWRSNFPRKGRKPKKKRKEKPKVTYLVVLVMAFLAAENENRPLEDLPQADFGRVPEWFLLSVRTNSITKNFVNGKLGPLFVFVVIQRMFSSWVRQRTLRFVFGDCRSFYFHSLIESTFLVSKRLLCLYDKQNNT